MTIIPCPHTNERAIFACAQAGCERCLEYLVESNKGLIHAVVRKARIGGVPYQEVVEEGRIGLWEAIKGYDPMRGTTFSTYAWWKILGEVWKYARAFSQKGERWEEEPYEAFDAEMAETSWEQKQIAEFVKEALAYGRA